VHWTGLTSVRLLWDLLRKGSSLTSDSPHAVCIIIIFIFSGQGQLLEIRPPEGPQQPRVCRRPRAPRRCHGRTQSWGPVQAHRAVGAEAAWEVRRCCQATPRRGRNFASFTGTRNSCERRVGLGVGVGRSGVGRGGVGGCKVLYSTGQHARRWGVGWTAVMPQLSFHSRAVRLVPGHHRRLCLLLFPKGMRTTVQYGTVLQRQSHCAAAMSLYLWRCSLRASCNCNAFGYLKFVNASFSLKGPSLKLRYTVHQVQERAALQYNIVLYISVPYCTALQCRVQYSAGQYCIDSVYMNVSIAD